MWQTHAPSDTGHVIARMRAQLQQHQCHAQHQRSRAEFLVHRLSRFYDRWSLVALLVALLVAVLVAIFAAILLPIFGVRMIKLGSVLYNYASCASAPSEFYAEYVKGMTSL